MRATTDPRTLPGSMVSVDDDPLGRNNVLFDTSRAVLLQKADIALCHGTETGMDAIAMLLEGRINHSQDRAEVLFLFDEDGAAAIISQLLSLGARRGPEFLSRLRERVNELTAENLL